MDSRQILSNARPLAIFAGYLATAAALTTACLATIARPSRPRRRSPPVARVFAALAALSLASTWYYMLSFFHWSYLDWRSTQSLPHDAPLLIGDWLRDSALFKQAWAATLETPARAWWALQIFGFCANWSLTLASQGVPRRIPRLWLFMLLGQVVAISFAMNLSFLAILSHQDSSKPHRADATDKPKTRLTPVRDSPSRAWQYLLLGLCIVLALLLPDSFSSPRFMWLLMIIHVLVFLPLLSPSNQPSPEPAWLVKLVAQLLIVTFATARLTTYVVPTHALFSHPAVSSVGSDVACCWLSYAAWYFVGETSSEE